MRIQLSADGVELDFARRDDGKLSTSVAAARDGSVSIEITRAELRTLLLALARPLVEEHGAKIESADLTLASAGERALTARLAIRANKILSVDVVIDARVDIDERLTLQLSNLSASGRGPIDSIVAGALRPKLAELDGRRFDLAPEALSNVRLSGLSVDAGDPLRISGRFEA